MPFLRFSRDKRGYENTYLCHTFQEDGKSNLRLLYWFRTPPNVEVGRLALDPDAILSIEQSNPELMFDWDEILKAKPPSPVPERIAGRSERRPERGRRAGRALASGTPTSISDEAVLDKVPGLAARGADRGSGDDGESSKRSDSVTRSEGSGSHVVLTLAGEEGLAGLRERFAEMEAQIASLHQAPSEQVALESQAALLNPDAWNSVEEARERIACFDGAVAALRKVLEQRRRSSQRSDSPPTPGIATGREPPNDDDSDALLADPPGSEDE